jgi:hypothetical protein
VLSQADAWAIQETETDKNHWLNAASVRAFSRMGLLKTTKETLDWGKRIEFAFKVVGYLLSLSATGALRALIYNTRIPEIWRWPLYFLCAALTLLLVASIGRWWSGRRKASVDDRQGSGDAREDSTPSSSWVRFLSVYPEIAGPPQPGKEQAKKPQKVRCEFLNCTEFSYKVKVISWDRGKSHGLDAGFWRGCLQLRIANAWYPEWYGAEELHVPPGEAFRIWLYPNATFSDDQFKARVYQGNLGAVHLFVNGTETAVSVG